MVRNRMRKRCKNGYKLRRVVGILVVMLLCITGKSVIKSKYNLNSITYILQSKKISEEICLIQITDLHNSIFGSDNKHLISKAAMKSPDLIMITGDLLNADELLIRSIPQALAVTDFVCSSINLGSTKTGINMDAVKLMGEIIKKTAEASKENNCLGCAKLVVFCNAPDDNPFMAGAFHGVTEADAIINVGVSGPGVVKHALEKVRGENFEVLCETIKKTAFKVTRVGQLVAQEASKRLNIPFGIIDLSLAPTPAIGDSVADILEEIGLEHAGAPGTTAALALLNDQVKKGGVMASSYVGGLSGAFIPVSEDQGMINAVNDGALTIEKLEAMTCVCSVGLDMIAIPGDTKASTISGIIADELAIGMVNQKTTAVRLIPVIGKGVGETVEFGGLLGYAPIMPVNNFSCEAFVNRTGRIPAPIHSFKN